MSLAYIVVDETGNVQSTGEPVEAIVSILETVLCEDEIASLGLPDAVRQLIETLQENAEAAAEASVPPGKARQ